MRLPGGSGYFRLLCRRFESLRSFLLTSFVLFYVQIRAWMKLMTSTKLVTATLISSTTFSHLLLMI
nr:MAG TPA: hypothetical protein [Caudoviricetes sp.]